jgi:hypothetical protein
MVSNTIIHKLPFYPVFMTTTNRPQALARGLLNLLAVVVLIGISVFIYSLYGPRFVVVRNPILNFSNSQNEPYTPPATNDVGQQMMNSITDRWNRQCEALVKQTGKQCACGSESTICISAMGGVLDISPAGHSSFDAH